MNKLILIWCFAIPVLGLGQKFKLTDTLGKIDKGDLVRDSLKREFIQVESIIKLNQIRKDLGMKPLIYDERLKPAAYHNIVYNRYCQWNKIFQPGLEWEQEGKYTQTHVQYVDIPNFDEIVYPDQRIKLLEKNVLSKITEELTVNYHTDTHTFDRITSSVWDRYKICSSHWNALTTNKEWNSVYMYWDTKTGLIIVILGKYGSDYILTEEYKKISGEIK